MATVVFSQSTPQTTPEIRILEWNTKGAEREQVELFREICVADPPVTNLIFSMSGREPAVEFVHDTVETVQELRRRVFKHCDQTEQSDALMPLVFLFGHGLPIALCEAATKADIQVVDSGWEAFRNFKTVSDLARAIHESREESGSVAPPEPPVSRTGISLSSEALEYLNGYPPGMNPEKLDEFFKALNRDSN